jgi:hypothetical protein
MTILFSRNYFWTTGEIIWFVFFFFLTNFIIMKKILLVAMIFVSCQQQISLPETVSTAEEQKAAAFLNNSDRNVQRDAFAMLSAKEKAAVWLNHIAEYKQKHELTPMQLNLIKRLERMATPENYASAEQAAITEVRFVKPWMAEAEKHFSAIEILELACELKSVNSEYAGKKGEGSGGGEGNFICNIDS